jgi:hypothetical protein
LVLRPLHPNSWSFFCPLSLPGQLLLTMKR